MPNPATTADVVARWRPLSAQETINATTFLDDAWGMLKRRMTRLGVDIETAIAADADLAAEVVRILATAVLRVMKNPDGKRSESIDDYMWHRDQSIAAGLLYFTDDELEELSPESTGGGAFSINLIPGYPESRFS